MIDGRQITAARALLGITQEEVANRAQLSISAMQALEAGSGDIDHDRELNLAAVRTTLEDAGIIFIDERATSAAGGAGVRLAVASASVDTNEQQTVQYPEMARNGPFGAGG
ncbi:helix-turn-helix transcriptional regulator [Rhizobium sp. 18065]|uniref:helix-turn-helix domain-containing protein n=1 Tax=Rhizobium sp. 18065 TaxID=2681411 RepID=UPI00135866DC|nr:helix-turn-helix transcriptional regulator [Rhizobium sp. 18065]